MSINEFNKIVPILRKGLEVEVDNIPSIDSALLFVWNYKPTAQANPLSIAFPLNEPKCWTSVERTSPKSINNKGPSYHPKYKYFSHKEVQFYPYSIQAIPMEKMNNLKLFNEVCLQMHEHMFGV